MGQDNLDNFEQRLSEAEKTLTEVRIKQAEQEGSVKDLLGWREVFQRDIKDSFNSLNNKMDKELYEMGKSITNLNDKIDANNKELHGKLDNQAKRQEDLLRQATSKLPLWASVLIGVILTLGGWGIEVALYVHK